MLPKLFTALPKPGRMMVCAKRFRPRRSDTWMTHRSCLSTDGPEPGQENYLAIDGLEKCRPALSDLGRLSVRRIPNLAFRLLVARFFSLSLLSLDVRSQRIGVHENAMDL